MEAENIKSFKEDLRILLNSTFRFLVGIVNIIITVFLLIGACSSIVLLYKMFPDIAIPILTAMLTIFSILHKIIVVVLMFGLITVLVYLIFEIAEMFGRQNVRIENRKKKFMDDLVKKLKKEVNKK